MSRTDQIIEGLAGQNEPAEFEGRKGYWCQGDCVFIDGAKSPYDAIEKYREQIAVAKIGVTHNMGASGILRAIERSAGRRGAEAGRAFLDAVASTDCKVSIEVNR